MNEAHNDEQFEAFARDLSEATTDALFDHTLDKFEVWLMSLPDVRARKRYTNLAQRACEKTL